MARSYKHALRAKGIKPIRRPAHTKKQPGDVELLPVRGVHVHCGDRPFLTLLRSDKAAAEKFFGVPMRAVMGEMA